MKLYLPEELFRYPNHPLKNIKLFCKCGGQMQAPVYPGDYFDCMECKNSVAPTPAQIEKMRYQYDKNGYKIRI